MSRVLPVLFNTDMVHAILDGRKTVTRRVIMPHNRKKAKKCGYCQGNGLWIDASVDNLDKKGHIKDYSVSPCWMSYDWYIERYAPYRSGDTLYVRETWSFLPCVECMDEGPACNVDPVVYDDGDCESEGCFVYKASHPRPERVSWTPSIHMPKAAARIWLKVKNVRVERLQDIDDEGAKAEGANWKNGKHVGFEEKLQRSVIERFAELWNSTLKKGDLESYGWDANPFVWVIEFERCKKPE